MSELRGIIPELKRTQEEPEGEFVDHAQESEEPSDVINSLLDAESQGQISPEFLDSIGQRYDNFYIREMIARLRREPLADYDIGAMRVLLHHNRMYLPARGDFLDPEDYPDEEINELFKQFREENYDYCAWVERGDLKQEYEDNVIKNGYNVTPLSLQGESSEVYDKKIRDFTFGRISPRFGVIYRPDLTVDSYFELSPDTEDKQTNHIQEYGQISESHLEFFLDKFTHNPDDLIYYYQIADQLPGNLREAMATRYGIAPLPAFAQVKTRAEFDQLALPDKEELLAPFRQTDATKFLIDQLAAQLESRKAEAAEKSAGFRSEDTDQLTFFLSFVEQDPRRLQHQKHFSLPYYFYIRKDLPPDLVTEFEDTFHLVIPEHLKQIDTLDQYLNIDDAELFTVLTDGGFEINQMASWLSDRLRNLRDEIQQNLPSPANLDEREILQAEGLKTDGREITVALYHSIMELPMRHSIEDRFGIKLADFSVREQMQFVTHLYSKSDAEVLEMAEILSTPPESGQTETVGNRYRSFLSLENDQAMGEVIMSIARTLPREISDRIFAKYAEIVSEVTRVESYLAEASGDDENVNRDTEAEIQRNLLSSGRKLLRDIVAKELPVDEIISRLERCHSDVLLYAATVNELKRKNVDISSLDMPNIRVETLSGDQLSEDDKRQMLLISESNWVEKGERGERVIGEFETLLKNRTEKLAGSEFYIIRHDQRVLSFFLLRLNSDGSYYCGSLNVSPEVKSTDNFKLLMGIFTEVTADKHIVAKCDPKSLVTPAYINQFGFRAYGISDDGTLLIERDLAQPTSKLAGLTAEEMLRLSMSRDSDVEVLVYTFPAQLESFRSDLLNGGIFNEMVITNFQNIRKKGLEERQIVIGFERFVRVSEPVAR